MQLDLAVLSHLPLAEAATDVTTGHLDRFPPLITDTCLKDQASTLVQAVVADYQAGTVVKTETLTMPRRGFSPRPVTIVSPGARTLYTALVRAVSHALTPTRTREAWTSHQDFPNAAGDWAVDDYLVQFDIASCYEYIEHPRLREELLTRTMEVPRVEALMRLLGEIYGKARGLPQLSTSSDTLADIYLEVLERSLLRTQRNVSRYADDFKVDASDWGRATQAIEDAAEQARDLGLILATEKTFILKASTVADQRQAQTAFFNRYFSEAKESFTQPEDFWNLGYGEPIEALPGLEETMAEALRLVFDDWYKGQKSPSPPEDLSKHSQYLPAALTYSAESETRIENDWLTELVFHEPLRLESVCGYLLARSSEPTENWTTLDKLAAMPRQSPWAKLWLLHVAGTLDRGSGWDPVIFDVWAEEQLRDRHEVVRAQAAWYLADSAKSISEEQLGVLYGEASSLTRPALAAACAARGLSPTTGMVKAVKQDSVLTAAAYKGAVAST